jgi:2-dehydro-3-deoxyphosphogluconate aldolase/(4S)-4-hydroxy-2-oxoglutarate aldolase
MDQSRAVAVGVGGALISGAKTGEFQSITDMAKKFLEKIKEARGL